MMTRLGNYCLIYNDLSTVILITVTLNGLTRVLAPGQAALTSSGAGQSVA